MKSMSHITNLKHVYSISYSGTWMLIYKGGHTSISVVCDSVVSGTCGEVLYFFYFLYVCAWVCI